MHLSIDHNLEHLDINTIPDDTTYDMLKTSSKTGNIERNRSTKRDTSTETMREKVSQKCTTTQVHTWSFIMVVLPKAQKELAPK